MEKASQSLLRASRVQPAYTTWNPAGLQYHRSCQVRHACAQLFLAVGGEAAEKVNQTIDTIVAARAANPTPAPSRGLAAPGTPPLMPRKELDADVSKGATAATASAAAADAADVVTKLVNADAAGDGEKRQQEEKEPGGAEQKRDPKDQPEEAKAGAESLEGAAAKLAMQGKDDPQKEVVVVADSSVSSPAKLTASPSKPGAKAASWKSSPGLSRMTELLRKACMADGQVRVPVHDVQQTWASTDLSQWIEGTMCIEDPEGLDDARRHWKVMLSQATYLKAGVSKAAMKLKSHMERLERDIVQAKKTSEHQEKVAALAGQKQKPKRRDRRSRS